MRRVDWSALSAAERATLLQRPASLRSEELRRTVGRILEQVRADGDVTLRALTRKFDGVEIGELLVDDAEYAAAAGAISDAARAAIDEAYVRIRSFHEAQQPLPLRVETAPGVVCERIARPIASVGLYVPAGSAPLPSSALMLGVPAQLAGCERIVLCSPPMRDGRIEPHVLYAAQRCGIREVFKLGGAQAIAAMAWGTESVPRCDKLFGPGNAYVTEAKLQLAGAGIAIDMPAGPSEVMVIADSGADAAFIASDLLSQAEHGSDSQVLLVATDGALIDAVLREIETQIAKLPRADIARAALAHALLIAVPELATAADVANAYAPEHLIVQTRDPGALLPRLRAAGSIFLGAYAAESLGDYCSGTNHVLPTSGAARAFSGVSLASFLNFITVQEVSVAGLRAIGPCAITLAGIEGLDAHANAVRLRLERAP
ncbi:MAG: histidinol dehydrogenase [Xanthomonadales bacterium]|nr:histidinol dehydrogenase [Xanthomonadales bacterium]MCC6560426.1 histidinol dehydrogenase [Xanthomonadales bacterium]